MTKPTADQIVQTHRAKQQEVLARIRWQEQAAIIATAEALTPKEEVSDED